MHNPNKVAASALMAAFVLGGCVSATPRPYAPLLRPPPADPAAFDRDFKACSSAVAAGKRDFGPSRGAIVAGGVGGLAAVPVLGASAAAARLGGDVGTSLAASGAALVMLVPLMTYSLSSSHRRHNELEVQAAMKACLAPSGYDVAAWTLVPRQDASPTTETRPTPSNPPPI